MGNLVCADEVFVFTANTEEDHKAARLFAIIRLGGAKSVHKSPRTQKTLRVVWGWFFFFILPLPLLVCSVCSVGIVPVKYCVKSQHKGHHYVWRLVLPFTYCALHLVNTCLLALRRMCVCAGFSRAISTHHGAAFSFSLFTSVCATVKMYTATRSFKGGSIFS